MPSLLQTHLFPATGVSAGIPSVCSAHPLVLRAAAEQAVADGSLLLVEATSNQVNQDGGYTGMRPRDFRSFLERIATTAGLPLDRIILGGDHLGPNPWRHLPAEAALARAETMVEAYAAAGFSKIHLDASMSCAGDPTPLSDEEVAARSVRLCQAAERSAPVGSEKPVYIIGTEVPTPGGATHSLSGLDVTAPPAAAHTLAVHHQAFLAAGLADAWSRVVALVVQPGVEFDHDSVVDYDPTKAADLVAWRRDQAATIVFEAHSTDYQNPAAYRELVTDGFAILKVGPQLTFALREALDALAAIEAQLIASELRSNLLAVIDRTMLDHPKDWQPYYAGTPAEQARLRRFSYSDRVRYYWHYPEIAAAVARLFRNLAATPIPESMLSLYLPAQYARVRLGTLAADPASLVVDKVKDVLRVYGAACS